MKDFLKFTFATLTGLILFSVISTVLSVLLLISILAIGSAEPKIESEGILKIDMAELLLTEQSNEIDPVALIQNGSDVPTQVGIWDAIQAINTAAADPGIKFIYLLPDVTMGGISQIEEFRTALKNFRQSGKAVISFIENPTNAGYYLASVSDKIYMTPYDGNMNTFCGVSSQMIFLKDILDKFGVNVQLIRHGKYKSAGEMFVRNSSSKENFEQNEAMVKSIWKSWGTTIAESRDMTIETLDDLLNNLKLNFSEDFLAAGLVDELLTHDELKAKLASLYMVEDADNVKYIAFEDYYKIKSKALNFSDKKIAIIYADGDIIDGKNKQQVAGDHFVKIISKIRKDDSVKAVVLRVNSPGGSVLASEKIKGELDLLRENVPVIASYGNYAASGGYWISANSDYIFSNATTLTGSIGVFSMIPDLSKTVKDKLHINITPVNSHSHSDMMGLMRPLDNMETAYMQASVEKIYDKFTSLVSKGRNMTVSDVDEVAQGRVWTGADALEIGLVDQIGTLEDAVNYAAKTIEGVTNLDDVAIEVFPKPQTTLEMLMESINGDSEVFADTPLENVEAAFKSWNSTESGKVYARLPYEFIIR